MGFKNAGENVAQSKNNNSYCNGPSLLRRNHVNHAKKHWQIYGTLFLSHSDTRSILCPLHRDVDFYTMSA